MLQSFSGRQNKLVIRYKLIENDRTLLAPSIRCGAFKRVSILYVSKLRAKPLEDKYKRIRLLMYLIFHIMWYT